MWVYITVTVRNSTIIFCVEFLFETFFRYFFVLNVFFSLETHFYSFWSDLEIFEEKNFRCQKSDHIGGWWELLTGILDEITIRRIQMTCPSNIPSEMNRKSRKT